MEDGEYLWQCLCYIELNMVRCGVVEHPRDWAWVGYHDAGVVSHYKNLLEVEDAFCHLKSYLRVRPVFHWRPDRVRSHVRICFLAYWLSAKLEVQWRQKDQTIEVHNLLRQLQSIRLGRLEVGGKIFKNDGDSGAQRSQWHAGQIGLAATLCPSTRLGARLL